MGTFHSTLHLPSFTKQENLHCTEEKPSKAPRDAQALGFVHLHSPDGQCGVWGRKKGNRREAELWLQWFQEEPKASSSWPHLLQLCPPCPQHGILIAKKDKLKVPEETWPSLTKSSEDKSKNKLRIILRTWNKPGQKGWTLIITPEGSKWLQAELGDTDPVSSSLLPSPSLLP